MDIPNDLHWHSDTDLDNLDRCTHCGNSHEIAHSHEDDDLCFDCIEKFLKCEDCGHLSTGEKKE